MLGPGTLDAAHFPQVLIQSVRVAGSAEKLEVTVRITLHGMVRDIKVPVIFTHSGDELACSGSFEIKQSEFGITPYSALGGGLQVADTLKVHFKIIAAKFSPPGP